MRSLLRFLYRYNFQILFLVLELIALYLVISSNPIPHSRAFAGLQTISGAVFEKSYGLRQYLFLKNENSLLAKENSRLRSLGVQSNEIEGDYDVVAYSSDLPITYDYIPARVINNSVNKQSNYITLNKGSLSGISPEMAVVSPDGIVGVVKDVSAHYSTVIPVLNSKFQVSVVHKKSGYFGSLVWDGKDYKEANVNEIPVHVDLEPGDSIVTSGYSALFPPGEMVGEIISAGDQEGGSFRSLRIGLSTDFKKLSRVYIIHNRGRDERLNLEILKDDQ